VYRGRAEDPFSFQWHNCMHTNTRTYLEHCLNLMRDVLLDKQLVIVNARGSM
jgi:hypothetical protein